MRHKGKVPGGIFATAANKAEYLFLLGYMVDQNTVPSIGNGLMEFSDGGFGGGFKSSTDIDQVIYMDIQIPAEKSFIVAMQYKMPVLASRIKFGGFVLELSTSFILFNGGVLKRFAFPVASNVVHDLLIAVDREASLVSLYIDGALATTMDLTITGLLNIESIAVTGGPGELAYRGIHIIQMFDGLPADMSAVLTAYAADPAVKINAALLR